MVEIRIFGGVGEIGGNKILVEDDDSRIFLDFGMSFGKMGEFFQDFSKPRTNSALRDLLRLGILPRLDGIYRADACRLDGLDEVLAAHEGFEDLWTAPVESYAAYQAKHGRPFVDGVVLSHAHLDHFGHFGYLDPAIPIHSTPVTATMLRAIERVSSTSGMEGEVTVTSRRVVGRNSKGNHPGAMKIEKEKDGSEVVEIPRPLHSQAPYTPFKVGAFKVTLIPVDHSVPGAASALIETRDGKRIYYTGDVRFHGSFHETTKRLRDTVRGLAPDVMLCEGTRITSDEVDDEEHVRAGLGATVKATRGLAMVDFGWKDTSRFETVQKVAAAAGRELVVGHKLAYLARQLDGVEGASVTSLEKYGNVRVYRRRIKSALYSNARDDDLAFAFDRSSLLRKAVDIRRHPERYLLAVSQWEMTELLDIDPPAGSTFTRAQCEPYDDEMASDLARQANWLRRWNIPLKWSEKHGVELPQVAHASGHACGPHIEEFVRLVAPKTTVPIHTEHEERFEKASLGRVVRAKVGEAIRV